MAQFINGINTFGIGNLTTTGIWFYKNCGF